MSGQLSGNPACSNIVVVVLGNNNYCNVCTLDLWKLSWDKYSCQITADKWNLTVYFCRHDLSSLTTLQRHKEKRWFSMQNICGNSWKEKNQQQQQQQPFWAGLDVCTACYLQSFKHRAKVGQIGNCSCQTDEICLGGLSLLVVTETKGQSLK